MIALLNQRLPLGSFKPVAMTLVNPASAPERSYPVVEKIEGIDIALAQPHADGFLHQLVGVGCEQLWIGGRTVGWQRLSRNHGMGSAVPDLLNRRRFIVKKTDGCLGKSLLGRQRSG